MMSETHEHFDVAIVGSGPSGMTCALLLAKRGHRVLVLERWPNPYPLPRAVGFDGDAARTFQDLGIIDEMLKISWSDSGGYYWRNAAGELLLYVDITRPSPTGWSTLNIFSQPQLEEVMRTAMAHEERITVRSGVEVTEVVDQGSDVIIRSARQTGAQGQIVLGEALPELHASYVIGADGANSLVRKTIGADETDLGFFYDWFVIDVIPHVEIEWPPGGLQICDPAHPVSVIPGGPGRRRWEFMLMPDENPDDINTDDEAWRRVAEWGLTPENSTLERRTVYRFQAKWANTWAKGRLVLVGDAAHLMPPFAGQGMNSGLRDAANAAWKLDLVLAGLSPQSLLESITEERRRHVQYAIRYSVALGQVICIIDPDKAKERDQRMLAGGAISERVLPPLPDPTFESGIVRREVDGTTVAPAGHVAPQFAICADGTSVKAFDDVFGRPAALVSAASLSTYLNDASRQTLTLLDYPLIDVADPSGGVRDITGGYKAELERLGAVAALIRPDGFYFGVARNPDDINALVADYSTQLGLDRGHAAPETA